MPDTKITALAAITTVDPAADVLPIVDISDTSMAASGTTKKITSNQILGAGGTATLASATITGDLTVDTSTLVVTSSQDRVGIGFSGNASSGRLQISQPLGSTIDGALRITDNATTSFVFNNVSSGVSGIWSSGAIAFGVGSGTFTEAMRLNATGLGVGVASPTYKLDVSSSSNIVGRLSSSSVFNTGFNITNTTGATWSLYSFGSNDATLQNSFGIYHQSGTSFLQITQAGNVGISVTPSAGSTYKVIQGGGGIVFGSQGTQSNFTENAYLAGAGTWTYATNAAASLYQQAGGTHTWYRTSAGTGNIAWTQAMTLDASGRLLVGTVTSGTSSGDGIVKLGTYGHCISQTGTSIASGSSVDLTVVTSGVGYQGFLSVANTLDANANARTQTTFSVFGRGASSTITQIATANGPTSGAAFTVTTPSNGVIRITNTSGNIATISAQFFGGASA